MPESENAADAKGEVNGDPSPAQVPIKERDIAQSQAASPYGSDPDGNNNHKDVPKNSVEDAQKKTALAANRSLLVMLAKQSFK